MTIAQISRQLLPLQSPGCIPCTEDTHTYVSHHLANFPSRRGCHQCRMGTPQALFEVRPWQCHLHQKIFPFSFFPHFLALLFPKATSLAQLPSSAPHCLSRCSAVTSSQKKESSPTWKVRPSCPNSLCSCQKGHRCSTTPRASSSHHSCCQQLIPRVFFVLLVRGEGSGCSSSSAVFHYPLDFP